MRQQASGCTRTLASQPTLSLGSASNAHRLQACAKVSCQILERSSMLHRIGFLLLLLSSSACLISARNNCVTESQFPAALWSCGKSKQQSALRQPRHCNRLCRSRDRRQHQHSIVPSPFQRCITPTRSTDGFTLAGCNLARALHLRCHRDRRNNQPVHATILLSFQTEIIGLQGLPWIQPPIEFMWPTDNNFRPGDSMAIPTPSWPNQDLPAACPGT